MLRAQKTTMKLFQKYLVLKQIHFILYSIGLFLCCRSEAEFKKIFVDDEKVFHTSTVLRDFLVDSYEKNRLLWELKAKKAYINWDHTSTLIFNPRLKHIDKEKNETTRIYGEKGEFMEKKGVLFLEKNVRVIAQNGKKIYTDNLYWYKRKELIKTNAPVKVVMPDGSAILGVGFRADMRLNKIKIKETTGKYYAK